MQLLATSDIHGNTEIYEKLFKLMASGRYEGAVIAGDICPGFDIETQRKFISNWLLPKLKVLRKNCQIPLFMIMGNDDFSLNTDLLEKGQKENLLFLIHMNIKKIDKFTIAGYSFINQTPFMIKDWERDEKIIESDLKKLANLSDPKKTIYVMHAPPYNTDLDILYNGEHVGSQAIRTFIEKYQPWLTIHGHIHESAIISGYFGQKIGKSLAINCCQRILCIDIRNRTFKIVF
jgi:Icc-related predicted phosphoesterase